MKHLFTLVSILLSYHIAICQDDCSKALEFKDKIQIKRTGNTIHDIHNWFISQNGQEVTSSGGWDANIGFVYNGVPIKLGGGSNSSDYDKIVNAINTGNTAVFSNNFVDYIFKEILKPEAYKAWSDCIKEKQYTKREEIEAQTKIKLAEINSQKSGLIGEITNETDESFILKIKWQPAFGVNSVKLKPPVVSGATYIQSTYPLDEEISSEFVSIPFYKTSGKTVSLTINTVGNKGSFDATLTPKSNKYSKTLFLTKELNDTRNAAAIYGFGRDYTIKSGEHTYITFKGTSVSNYTITLTKNKKSNEVEQSTITGTLEIRITDTIKHRNDIQADFGVGNVFIATVNQLKKVIFILLNRRNC